MNRRAVWVTAPYRRVEDDDDIQDYKKPWVNLTDEEIQECISGLPTQTMDAYARRIEAKLRSKNAT